MNAEPVRLVSNAVSERPTPAGGRRVLAALCAAAFLASLNFFATTPFYTLMARDLHTTVPILGQLVTLMVLSSAGLGLVVGPLGDRYGYRWPPVIGVVAIAVLLGTGLAPNYPVVLGFSVVGGLGDALVFGLARALGGTHFEGDTRRRALGWTIGPVSSAPIVGIPLLTAIGGVSGVARGAGRGRTRHGGRGMVRRGDAPTRRPASYDTVAGSGVARGLHAAASGPAHLAPLRRRGAACGLVGRAAHLPWGVSRGCGRPEHAADRFRLHLRRHRIRGRDVHRRRPARRCFARASVTVSSVTAGLLVGPMLLFDNAWVAMPLLLVISLPTSMCSVGVATLLAAQSPAGAGTTMVLNGSLINAGMAGGAALGGTLIVLGGYSALGLGLPVFAVAAAALAWWS